jgi:DNA-binding MarR family transcriptional regulator
MPRRAIITDTSASADLTARPGVPVQPTPSALARRFNQICVTVVSAALAEENLSPLQYAVLAYLYVHPDIDQNSLAARLGVDRASTSQLVDQLEEKGLVERRVNDEDRRARLLCLSRDGLAVRERLHPVGRAAEKEILSTLTASERDTLIALLTRVVTANEARARPGAGRKKPKPRNSTN